MSSYDHRIDDLSIEAGAHMVRLIEPAIAELAAQGEPDERCKSCAFRLGTIPNKCADTVVDAMKCGMEGTPFYCHVNPGKTCHGWFAMRYAFDGKNLPAPWPFSEDCEKAAK